MFILELFLHEYVSISIKEIIIIHCFTSLYEEKRKLTIFMISIPFHINKQLFLPYPKA